MKPKLKQTPTGVFVGSIIASGEVEIGFQQVSELSHFAGVDYVGPLPEAVQRYTVFSSGIVAGASSRRRQGAGEIPHRAGRRAGLQEAGHGARLILREIEKANPVEIKVLSSIATKEAYLELVPQFEKATGHKVVDHLGRAPPRSCRRWRPARATTSS